MGWSFWRASRGQWRRSRSWWRRVDSVHRCPSPRSVSSQPNPSHRVLQSPSLKHWEHARNVEDMEVSLSHEYFSYKKTIYVYIVFHLYNFHIIVFFSLLIEILNTIILYSVHCNQKQRLCCNQKQWNIFSGFFISCNFLFCEATLSVVYTKLFHLPPAQCTRNPLMNLVNMYSYRPTYL